ncbi:MAG: type II toxin-antitoxin system Phd/YefM family antitoxin [Thermodesulfobacteriota bacterium]
MEATVVDLRYKMKEILSALERREAIRILYHGRLKGTIIPVSDQRKLKIAGHPFFGMRKGEKSSAFEQMNILRGGRYNAL